MDNVCHTLVGAAFGEAGLKRRTRYGNVALMIAANVPDIDVLVFATDTIPVSFRRGWTHGIAAQLLLPVMLTGLFVLVGRRARSHDSGPPLRAGWLLALSYVGVFSHVLLDYLNNYGVRLLTPFDWRWFYGDAVFIVDPWLWLALGAGVWLARRQRAPLPARRALVVSAIYIVLMIVAARMAREYVAAAWRAARGAEPVAVMAGPVPVSPITRVVVIDAGAHYETGLFTWWPRSVTFFPEIYEKNADHPAVAEARQQSREIRGFLVWSRFPFWTLQAEGGGTRVTVQDMRFPSGNRGFSASTVVSPAAAGTR